jgi:hypothetical protein
MALILGGTYKDYFPGRADQIGITPAPGTNIFGRNTGGNQGSTNIFGRAVGGGTQAASKPPDYLGGYNQMSGVKPGQVEGGTVQGFFANPSGKAGGFESLTAALLENPEVYKNVRDRYAQFGNDPVWLEQLNKASDKAKKGFEGGSFSMAPEVLSKMWK